MERDYVTAVKVLVTVLPVIWAVTNSSPEVHRAKST